MYLPSVNRIWPEIGRLFEDFESSLLTRSDSNLKVNLYEDDDHKLHLTAELPGYEPDDLTISVEGNELYLKGEKKVENEKDEDGSFLLNERYHESFERRLRLPYRVDPETVNAELKNGVLYLDFSQHEKDQPRTITVSTN